MSLLQEAGSLFEVAQAAGGDLVRRWGVVFRLVVRNLTVF